MQQRFLSAAYLLLSALLAFFVLWKGGKTIESTWLLTGGVWAFVFCALPLSGKQKIPRFAVLSLLLFLIWSLIAFFLSETKNYGLDEILRDGSLAALFITLVTLFQKIEIKAEVMKWLLGTISIALLISIAIGFVVYTLQPVNRFVGAFFDFRFHTDYWPNAWGEFLLLSWPLLVLWVQPWRKKIQWLRYLTLGITLGALLLSYSRGSFLAFCGQILLLLFLVSWQRRRELNTKSLLNNLTMLIGVPILAVGVFFAANFLRSQFHDVQSVFEKVTFTASEGTASIDERSEFWQQSVVLAKERPWFGWGPYSFRFIQPRLQDGILATSDHPHNVFSKFAVERGVFSAIFYLLFLLSVFLPAFLSIVRDKSSMAAPFLLTAAAGVLAHNLIDFNLQFVGIVFPLWIIFAFLATESAGKKQTVFPGGTAMFVSFAMASLCLLVAVRESPLQILSSQGRHAEVAGHYDEALSFYERAEGQWYPRDLLLSETSVFIASHKLTEAVGTLVQYRNQNPVDPRTFTIGGFLDLSLKNPDEALGQFSQAFTRGGQNDASIVRGLLLSLRSINRPAESREWEDKVMLILEQYTDAIATNAHFIALSRNVEETKQAIDLAKIVYPWRTPELIALKTRIEKESAEERARFTARPSGRLW